MADLTQIVDTLSSLTVMEAAELAKLLEEKWGVSAAAPVAVAAGGAVAAGAAPAAAEKEEFDVILLSAGDKKTVVVPPEEGYGTREDSRVHQVPKNKFPPGSYSVGDHVTATAPDRRGFCVGRPAQVWTLTPAGDAKFPDGHAQLAAQLIAAIRDELGDDALNRLIDRRAEEAKASYRAALAGSADLAERVTRLAAARTAEGYMAEAVPDCTAPGSYLLVESHCPICVAAHACQGFCRAELETFRDVLGPNVTVDRTGHIVQGDRRCVYRISPTAVPE